MALKGVQMRECGLSTGSSSLAVKAFQLSIAAAQNPLAIEYWDYLEHIEAPQWVDLSVEASLEGTEGDDPWFYQHHPHHETPLEELVFAPCSDFKQEVANEELNFTSKEVTSSSEQSLSLESSQERSELKNHENGRLLPSKPKRIQLRPACEIRKEDGKDGKQERSENSIGSSPSESFSAKLLATLMARLRTNEEVQTASDSNPLDDSLSSSKQMKGGDDTDAPCDIHVRTQRVRASIACVTLSGTSNHEGSTKPSRNATGSPLRNKENSSTPTRGKSALGQVKKPKLMNVRKSLATFEFGKNSNGTFSIGRSDGMMVQRRRLSCKSPRLKTPKSLRASTERKSTKMARVSPDTKGPPAKARAYGVAGDELAALIAKHNSKFLLKPKYEPRLHSTRDIREWERRTGQLYYSLQPIERVKVNQDITEFKRSKIL
ncbi:uncharacterized protein LOC9650860 isoform X1 [Selaginella moellendorffii]|uniref:uncharacterized protein LOC9650860 isoform X1 n=1 Tax=Selaginella moellendorffii TaxID=88036 RepID=UPI000D1CF93E|nr:uncharacterized protein LOC9650860 isoform X1 [Selaginella moellendorffii]|eukprot:XP_024532963.1 uncharacterized protein LOC9650860 isoform X1 [Selaginella moellendorffii]